MLKKICDSGGSTPGGVRFVYYSQSNHMHTRFEKPQCVRTVRSVLMGGFMNSRRQGSVRTASEPRSRPEAALKRIPNKLTLEMDQETG